MLCVTNYIVQYVCVVWEGGGGGGGGGRGIVYHV